MAEMLIAPKSKNVDSMVQFLYRGVRQKAGRMKPLEF